MDIRVHADPVIIKSITHGTKMEKLNDADLGAFYANTDQLGNRLPRRKSGKTGFSQRNIIKFEMLSNFVHTSIEEKLDQSSRIQGTIGRLNS